MSKAARWLWACGVCIALLAPVGHAQEGRGDVVYVPTPQVVVDAMLKMAKVGPKDFVIDLGSGDGRMVITAAKKFGARGFGVDLDAYLLNIANANAKKEGVSGRARFHMQNLFETDLSQATVITSYLLPSMNEKLRPTILALKPGTRLVAHDYAMGEWDPDDSDTLIVPEKTVGDPGKSYIFFWIVPARVAGRWETQVMVDGKLVPWQFNFQQHFQLVHGTARAGDRDAKVPQFRVAGEELAFKIEVPAQGKSAAYQFRGRVKGDAIEGTVTYGDSAGHRVAPWRAKLTQRGEPYMGAAGAVTVAGVRP
jgi:hypothetical protein